MKALLPCTCALLLGALAACNGGGAAPGAKAPADANAAAATAPAIAAEAAAVSTACASARSEAETLVCADPALSRLANELGAAYAKAGEVVNAKQRPALADEQERWDRQTRDLCRDAACLTQVYTDRIAVLSRNEPNLINQVSCETPAGASECVNVVAIRDPNSRIEGFNKAIETAGQAGKIIGCRTLIDIAAGTASGNHSFGGLCTREDTGTRTEVQICYDEMVGNFAIEPAAPGTGAVKNLVDFTNGRCAQA